MSDDFDDDKKRALSTIFLRCDILLYSPWKVIIMSSFYEYWKNIIFYAK